MGAHDTLARALSALEDHRDAADGEGKPDQTWHAEYSRAGARIVDGDGNTVATGLTNSDARLIVTLHRTINPQVSILEDALRAVEQVGPIVAHGERHRRDFDLARAILEEAR